MAVDGTVTPGSSLPVEVLVFCRAVNNSHAECPANGHCQQAVNV